MSGQFWRLNFKLFEGNQHWLLLANHSVRNPDSIQKFVGKEEGEKMEMQEKGKERKVGCMWQIRREQKVEEKS